MLQKRFQEIVNNTFDKCAETLDLKSTEYATEDRLFNFKQPTSLIDKNPAQVCLYYQMKHIASMVKIADDLNKGIMPSDAFLDEKIGDVINYCLLFKANVIEYREKHAYDKAPDNLCILNDSRYDGNPYNVISDIKTCSPVDDEE